MKKMAVTIAKWSLQTIFWKKHEKNLHYLTKKLSHQSHRSPLPLFPRLLGLG